MTELCFLTPSRGNAFMTELLRAVAGTVAEEGVPVSFAIDRYPAFKDGVAYVAIPHEFFVLAPEAGAPTPGHLGRTVGFCVEMPGTPWFTTTCHYGSQLGGLVDIRRTGVRALRMAGLTAVHTPLGYTPAWDRWRRNPATQRPVDVLYMGSADARRDRLLAGYAETLVGRSSQLLIPPERPKPRAAPSFLLDRDKYELLRSAKTLLNLHREGAEDLEWPRVLEAICNGCVVVTERSLDTAPLVAGEHLIPARAESLGLLADRLLDEPERLEELRLAAYDFVRRELPMATGARRLIEVAEDVASSRLRGAGTEGVRRAPANGAGDPLDDALAPLRAALKRVLMETRETRRDLAELRAGSPHDARGLRVDTVAQTPAYNARSPRMTVGISLHNYDSEIWDALSSVAASDYHDYEVLVLDDASTDRSAAVVRGFLEEHAWMPAVLMQHNRNAGLARTRNAIAKHARGDLIFVLDADNGVFPHALRRLVEALDQHPEATFAYPIIAVQEQGRPSGLLSRHGWDPSMLADANFIDAMALIRRDGLLEIGGYCDDPRLVGFEDYDLWCQVAERGWRGVHVPEILAWYRRTGHSMMSIATLDGSEARSLLSARAPRTFAAG